MAKLWAVLIVAILIRIFLSLSTFHPDIRAFNLGGQLIATGNILNLYDYLYGLSSENQLVKTFGTDLFIYPPLIYIYHGIYNVIFTLIFGQNIVNGFLIENARVFGNPLFNLHLLLLKIPYLLFDLLGAYFFVRLFNSQREKWLALVLWLFNPVSLYATYMMGQFDLVPMFFTVLALYFVNKKNIEFGALSLGMGAAFKVYPLLLLPALILLEKDWRKRIGLGFLGILPYLATILAYLPSPGFRANALLAGLTQKSFYAQIQISGGESLILFPMILIAVYLLFLFSKNIIETVWERFFVVLLIFFILTHFHPQWFVWLTPFLIIELIINRFKHLIPLLIVLISYICSLFFFDASLTVSLFSPLFPVLYSLPDIWKITGVNIDFNYSRSILQTIFAGVSLYYIFVYFPRRKEDI